MVSSEGNLHQTFRRLKGEVVRVVGRFAKKRTMIIIHPLAHLGFVKSSEKEPPSHDATCA
jgi:hypothetical protein